MEEEKALDESDSFAQSGKHIQSTQTTHVTRPKILKINWTTEPSGWVSDLYVGKNEMKRTLLKILVPPFALGILSLLLDAGHGQIREAIGYPFSEDQPPLFYIFIPIALLLYSLLLFVPVSLLGRIFKLTSLRFYMVYGILVSLLLFMAPLFGVILDRPSLRLDLLMLVDSVGFLFTALVPILTSLWILWRLNQNANQLELSIPLAPSSLTP